MQLDCLPEYTKLIPGVSEAINYLKKERGIKIGTSTGFTKVNFKAANLFFFVSLYAT